MHGEARTALAAILRDASLARCSSGWGGERTFWHRRGQRVV